MTKYSLEKFKDYLKEHTDEPETAEKFLEILARKHKKSFEELGSLADECYNSFADFLTKDQFSDYQVHVIQWKLEVESETDDETDYKHLKEDKKLESNKDDIIRSLNNFSKEFNELDKLIQGLSDDSTEQDKNISFYEQKLEQEITKWKYKYNLRNAEYILLYNEFEEYKKQKHYWPWLLTLMLALLTLYFYLNHHD